MRSAYALLGLSFLIIFIAAYLLIERAHAPSDQEPADNENYVR